MVNILQRTAAKMSQTKDPEVVESFKTNDISEGTKEVEVIEVLTISEAKTIKVNNPGKPMTGFTLTDLATEIGLMLETAMHKANVTTIEYEALGIFASANIVPRNFVLVNDEYTGRKFLELHHVNRITEIFNIISNALEKSSSEIISFPYTHKIDLVLPSLYRKVDGTFDNASISVDTMYLSPKEVERLDFSFIKEIMFIDKVEGRGDSQQLLAMKIDRKEWEEAPYRNDNGNS